MIGGVTEPKSAPRFSEMDFVCREALIRVDWTPLWLWVGSSRSEIQAVAMGEEGRRWGSEEAKPEWFVGGRSINLKPSFCLLHWEDGCALLAWQGLFFFKALAPPVKLKKTPSLFQWLQLQNDPGHLHACKTCGAPRSHQPGLVPAGP